MSGDLLGPEIWPFQFSVAPLARSIARPSLARPRFLAPRLLNCPLARALALSARARSPLRSLARTSLAFPSLARPLVCSALGRPRSLALSPLALEEGRTGVVAADEYMPFGLYHPGEVG